jgi:hypothetical protein
MYGLRTAVHLFHGVRDSSVSTYFVGVNCLPIKLLLVWVDRLSVKLMWIKAEKPVEKTGQVTSQAQKKKDSHSTRKRNAQRINQWKQVSPLLSSFVDFCSL